MGRKRKKKPEEGTESKDLSDRVTSGSSDSPVTETLTAAAAAELSSKSVPSTSELIAKKLGVQTSDIANIQERGDRYIVKLKNWTEYKIRKKLL